MSSIRARLVRLEQCQCPAHERLGWCCALTDPEDSRALPPTCPHGGRWLLMFTNAAAEARSDARHPGTLMRSFTIQIDRACSAQELADA
jgi:hypothetical protein